MKTATKMGTVDATSAAAKAMAEKWTALGMPCEIDAGPAGIFVYAGSRNHASIIALGIRNSAATRDPKAFVEGVPQFEPDEKEATAWWVCVRLDWKKF